MTFHLALWGGKAARGLLRLLGRDATYFPGQLALRLCPDFISRVGKPATLVAVTGTNGKTTCCNLVSDLLEAGGRRVLSNRKGSNIDAGIASALLEGASLSGRCRYDTGVLELDERSSARVFPRLTPDVLLCTNLFRDSMRRNATPDYIAGILAKHIPAGTKLILNADDLISSSLGPENPRVLFGVKALAGEGEARENIVVDAAVCPRCGEDLSWSFRRYHHIGRALCPRCGFRSPEPDIAAVAAADGVLRVSEKGEEWSCRLINDAVFNIYNEVAAIAVLRSIGLSREEVAAAFEKVKIAAIRFGEDSAGGKTVTMLAAKGLNAVACSRAFDLLSRRPGKKAVALMYDDVFDEKDSYENTAWIYDADYELLASPDVEQIVLCGPRALDGKLRLLLAGAAEDRISCVGGESEVADALRLDGCDGVFLLYDVYRYKSADAVRRELLKRLEARA